MKSKLLDYKLIGNEIRKHRVSNAFTIKKLSKDISISEHTIRNWEKGISLPSLKSIVKICNIYQIKVDDIIFYE